MALGEIEPYPVDIAKDCVYDLKNICLNLKPKWQRFSNSMVDVKFGALNL